MIGKQRFEEVFKDILREKWNTFERGNDLLKDIFVNYL
jgi:hypothetical protein